MIERTRHGEILELQMARPPANALSPDLLRTLADAVRSAPGEGAAAVVLSGAPGLFTGGLDVPLLMTLGPGELRDGLDAFFDAMAALAGSRVPVAAAVTGHSPAGGAVLALFCDRRIMASGEFVIGLNEVSIGIPMPAVVATALARVVGPRRAEELCVTGRLLAPDEAAAVGLVDEVVQPERVVEAACAWCGTVLRAPGFALAGTRAVTRRDLVEIVDRHRSSDVDHLVEIWNRPEIQGPLRALVERLGKK
jgi:enoyl-CoA hydratase/carnithine racemase